MAENAAPVPLADLIQRYLDGVSENELRLQQCAKCSTVRFPPRPVCSECHGRETVWIVASGRARLWSFGVFHKAYLPDHPVPTPYNVAVVQLAEGPKMISNVIGIDNDALQVDMPLQAVVDDAGNGALIKFRPVDA